MARVKFGSIITSISGSVGGTTFRRFNGGVSMGRRSSLRVRQRVLVNDGLAANIAVINSYASLTPELIEAWDNAALLYVFADKFGVMRNLSGRELYIKLNCNAALLGLGAVDVEALNSSVATFTFELGIFDVTNGECEVVFDGLHAGTYATIQAALLRTIAATKTISARKVLGVINLGSASTIDIYEALSEWLPYIAAGDVLQVWATGYNASGFKGSSYSNKTICV